MKLQWLWFCVVLLSLATEWSPAPLAAEVIDFEELSVYTETTADGSYYNGNPGTGESNSDGWTSGSVFFENNYTNAGSFDFWNGWAYSSIRDAQTPGFFNQYASQAGSGAGGSDQYAVGYLGSTTTASGDPLSRRTMTFAQPVSLQTIDMVMTTYTNRFLRDGLDGFAPEPDSLHQFGDGDFYRLTITGFDDVAGTGSETGSLTIDLANYGGPGTEDDFRLEDWQTFDLQSLGTVRSLSFAATSSLISSFTFDGNTTYNSDVPAYVAIDNLSFTAIPEPSTMLAGVVVTGLLLYRRRRRR